MSMLPPTVILLSQRLSVESQEKLCAIIDHNGDVDEGGEEAHAHQVHGLYDSNLQLIKLDAGNGHERMRETLMHETLHAMLSLAHMTPIMEQEMPGFGEHLVSALAPIMLAFLRDNPGVIDYLREVPSA